MSRAGSARVPRAGCGCGSAPAGGSRGAWCCPAATGSAGASRSLLLVADGLPGPDGLDPWCEAARAAAAVHPEPDALWQALSDIPVPEGDAAAAAPLLLWTGKASAACDPRDPAEALGRLLGTG